MKKFLALLLSLCMMFSLAACGEKKDNDGDSTDQVEDEENYNTGDASLDDPLNQDDIGEKELMVVSFGTSFNDSRRLTIGAVEKAMQDAFGKDYSVRRGFTSQIIIDHVKNRDGVVIDNVKEALDRAVANGVKTLVVQPTHLMNGLEYKDVEKELAGYADSFEQIVMGEPILTSDEDFQAVIKAITEATQEYDDGETAIVFMGHGTEADSNAVYGKMQEMITAAGYENYFIGTVEATPSLDDVLAAVGKGEYKKVVLEPLMIVAGDHANNDMASDEEDSWKTAFTKAGYEVECILRGLGEMEPIQQLLVEHAQAAIDSLGDKTEKPADDKKAEDENIVDENMVPIYGKDVKDGEYDVTVDSSSSMFKVEDCKLVVKDGQMTATMTMSGTGYLKLFMGTGEEAANASEDQFIPFVEAEGSVHTFTVPVEALDKGIDCSAFSKRKEQWYDRTLVFRADSLPADALQGETVTTAESLNLADGQYTADVTLGGGSGKAKVESPCKLTVKDGKVTATVVWSSSNYDYLKINDVTYDPVSLEPGSTFEIPVEVFDRAVAVIADTTAMSKPHEIDYTLTFDSASVAEAK